MSLRDLRFKHWAMIVIAAFWLLCNLNFSPEKEGASYFRVNSQREVVEQVAKNRAAKAAREENQRNHFSWNRNKKADKESTAPTVIPIKEYAPEELYVGIVPKESYAFLGNMSFKNIVSVWKALFAGELKSEGKMPSNVIWGLATPIAILILLVLCVVFGGNSFKPLRRELNELPEVDEAPDEEELDEEGDEEEEEGEEGEEEFND